MSFPPKFHLFIPKTDTYPLMNNKGFQQNNQVPSRSTRGRYSSILPVIKENLFRMVFDEGRPINVAAADLSINPATA